MSTQPVGVIPEWTMGDRLRKARELTGLSQSQFAKALEISPKTVGSYETGRVAVRRIVVRAWSMRTGVPVEWLETGAAPSPGGDGAVDGVPPKGFEPSTFRSNVRRFTAVHTVAA